MLNNVHYVCTSLSSEKLDQIDQKNWVCTFCVSTGNVDNNSNILELLHQIREGQKSFLERLTSSEDKINKLNKNIGDLSNQLSTFLKENAIFKEKIVVL